MYNLRYLEGVHFFSFLNILLKVDRLEKPEWRATSVIVKSGRSRSVSAKQIYS